MKPSIIARAFELAQSGEAQTVAEIEGKLKKEGYESVASHLGGGTIRRELRALIKGARPA